MMKHAVFCAALSAVGGCGLVNSHSLSTDYSLDAQHFTSPQWGGDGQSTEKLPAVPCDASTVGSCASAAPLLTGTGLQATCDTTSMTCVATDELRLSQLVNLSQQTSFPKEAVEFGIDAVAIRRVAYWVASNTLNFTTPKIEIYVAPQTAKDEHDDKAHLLGLLGPVPAKSPNCSDSVDERGDPLAQGARVCDMVLDAAGEAALASFAKNYGTPFQVIAHAVITAKEGDPVPSGSIDFYLRPVVGLSILK